MRVRRGPGKPVTHPNVACVELGCVYETYTKAAEAVGGSRYGVRKCCNGELKTHRGLRFVHTEMPVGHYSPDLYKFGGDT